MSKLDRCVFRLTPEEKDQIAIEAAKAGLSISDFVRSKVLASSKVDAAIANLTIMNYALANKLATQQLKPGDIANCKELAKEIANKLNLKFNFGD
jgi:hypothetical protein